MTIFQNVRVVLPDSVQSLCVAVSEGKVAEIADRFDIPGAAIVDGQGLYLAPGFVDIHVHGGGGFETMLCTPEAVVGMCRAHLMHGTTSILPTLSAAPMQTTLRALDAARAAIESGMAPNAAGVHLEGPFLSPAQAGAQLPENLLIPAQEDYEGLLDRGEGVLRIVGAAPELPGALAFGDACARRGITASVAHSDATYAQVEQAVQHGYSDITHLYSGCSTITRKSGFRVPGVVEAGLLLSSVTVQVIADLCHLPAELLRLVVGCRGADNVSLVTDALPFAGTDLTEGAEYVQANGQHVLYEDGVLKMTDRTAFCGSCATTDRLVRNMLQIGFPLHQVIRMASTTPARVAGLRGKGRIAVGYDADLVLFDDAVNLHGIWLSGEKQDLSVL